MQLSNKTDLVIMHISDLHRSMEQPISNNVLFNSIESDWFSLKTEKNCSAVDFIVVSGDIVSGTSGQSKEDLDKVDMQYEEAITFLTNLCDCFLSGQKEKLIVVPGNHDINWYYSKKSMECIKIESSLNDEFAKKREIFKLYQQQNSKYRWSWEDFQFYEIVNSEDYKKRFEAFSNFYKKFYGTGREYPLDPSMQFDIFNYPDLSCTIVGYNSCYNNDHMNQAGRINPECIANASRKLRNQKYPGKLLIAVWHHNTSGLPKEESYLDDRFLQNLISDNYVIGLHGHQHKTDAIYERSQIDSSDKMLIISAGSLCAGPRELPTGEKRQYNLIKIDLNNNKISLFVREMLGTDFQSPVWKDSNNYNDLSNIKFNLSKAEKTNLNTWFSNKLDEIADLVNHKDETSCSNALSMLNDLDPTNDMVHYLKLECYWNLHMHTEIINEYIPPTSEREALHVIHSLLIKKDKPKLTELLSSELVQTTTDHTVIEELTKLKKVVGM